VGGTAPKFCILLDGVVDATYTTFKRGEKALEMAFLRRKGNAYYLVHNVRREGKVKQLHLARLGERPRITDDVVRQVSRTYPFVDVNWTALREAVNNRVDLFDPKSAYVRSLVSALRNLNLDLADLFPPLLDVSEGRAAGHELVTQLRLLHSTVGVKLDQFDRAPRRGVSSERNFR
jgi:hypothetical protein